MQVLTRHRAQRPVPAPLARRIAAGSVAACLLACLLPAAPAVAESELEYGLEQHLLRRIELRGNVMVPADDLKAIMKIREPRLWHPLTLLGLGDRTALYQPHLLDAELRLLTRYYRQRGFHQVSVQLDSVETQDPQRGDMLHISIVEGPRTFLDTVAAVVVGPDSSGFALPDPADLLAGLAHVPGAPAPADLNDLGTDIYRLRTGLWERGHMLAQIRPVMTTSATDDPARRLARLVYEIDPGKAYRIADIAVEGRRRTRLDLIGRELSLSPGDLFQWSEVEASQQRLLDTSLFRDVGFRPVDTDTLAGTTRLLVEVVERKPAYYEFGLGVGTRERIRLLAAWGHNNLFGTGQRLRAGTRTSLNYEDVQRLTDGPVHPELNYRYDLLHTYPGVLGRLRLDSSVYLAKETRGESGLNLMSRGLSVGTRFAGSPRVSNVVEARIEEVDPSLHPDAKADLRVSFEASDLRPRDTRSLGWSFQNEGRDNPLRPQRGAAQTTRLEVAGGPLGGDNSFVKVSASWQGYRSFPLGGVIAMRASAGVVRPYAGSRARGADGVPYQERFFAGGATTVRGYLERSLGPQITDQAVLDSLELASDVPLSNKPARGGNYLLLTNAEWRFPLPLLRSWRVDGVAFVDGGNVWENARDIRLRSFRWRSYARASQDDASTKLWDYRYSVGCGVRVDTPVGPVRLDAGFPLKRALLSDAVTEDKVIYHFSLGFPF
jgi:outer membrane protein assembly complex protein YaeT